MSINLKIHNRNHIIKSILGNVETLTNRSINHSDELIVVNYHGTQKKFIPNLRKQLKYFKEKYIFISPDQLSNFYGGKLRGATKPFLLLTFDDGIKNNLYAADLLNELSIKAFFFIIPDFIDTPVLKQKDYFISFIRPEFNPEIDSEQADFCSMSWEDLKKLHSMGHAIGSHTQTHRLIAKHSTIENSKIEIIESRGIIAKKLGLPIELIDSFCSINNTLESIADKELKMINENYNYHFTTIPGKNSPDSDHFFIKRSNIESHWLLGAAKYSVGKWDLKRWKNITDRYLDILNGRKK